MTSATYKRITYLRRRGDLDTRGFREHWATVHAEIARGLPRVLSYRQNHVVRAGPPVEGSEPYWVDGIVELWFEDEEAVGAGFGSEVADRLIGDEKRFLSGLTGAAVEAGGPTPDWPEKLWVLVGRRDAGDDPAAEARAVERWAAGIGERLGASGHAVDRLEPSAPVLSRETLAREPELPAYAIAFGFDGPGRAAEQLPALVTAVGDAGFGRAQVFLTEEVRII